MGNQKALRTRFKTSKKIISSVLLIRFLFLPSIIRRESDRLPSVALDSNDITSTPIHTRKEGPFSDYVWGRYCKAGSPCIALLSAAEHGSILSRIDPRTLKERSVADGEESLRNRILAREAYCAVHGCDTIIDYNDYHKNRTMWLSDHGNYRVGPMPPHWKKVVALQRWLPLFDGIILLDMDTVLVDFNTSVYDMYNSTASVMTNGNVGFVIFRRGEMSNCVVDSWWYYGTSPGCRYFKYPHNHKGQTQNLDMPWFWYGVLKFIGVDNLLNVCKSSAEI
eukprot:CCRYP_013148-RA/>CCRYP_013148-RA protein AED:0.37 eAED:-0.88 QI:0/0/0/0.5/1/1/2/0/278